MQITMDDWRDGAGYDLDALDEVNDSERDELVKVLAGIARSIKGQRGLAAADLHGREATTRNRERSS